MAAIVQALAWEWINIALECTAAAWVRLPRFPLAVVGVNLVTHPLLVAVLSAAGRSPSVVLPCEAAVVLAEGAMLCALYRSGGAEQPSRRFLLLVSLVMNAASYGTGLLLESGHADEAGAAEREERSEPLPPGAALFSDCLFEPYRAESSRRPASFPLRDPASARSRPLLFRPSPFQPKVQA